MARIHVPAVLGFYDDADDLMHVAEKARVQEGFKNLDAYSPYPIHGMEEALGLQRSWTSTAARFGLFAGAFLGFSFQSWSSAIDWPVNIGGKPFISWPAWVPITFETGVLLAGFCNLFALLIACGMYPKPKTMILSKRITNDRFVMVIPVTGEEEEKRAIAFLRRHKTLKVKIADRIDKKRERVIFRAVPVEGETTAS